VLEIIHQVEKEQGLPSPMLGGQWAKTAAEVRSSWMITGLTAAREPAAFQAQRVFQTARALGVRHIEFDADGNELKRINPGPPLNVQPGPVSCRVSARGTPAARARITLLLERP
jgi:hypothetical protein